MAEQLVIISNILLIGALLFAFIALFLWFRFHIWKIIGDLTGKNERRSLARMRAGMDNHSQTDKKRIVHGNYRTRKFFNTGFVKNITEKPQDKTVILREQDANTQMLNEGEDVQTQLLCGNTMVLNSNQDTVVLAQTEKLNQEFTVIETILFVHTEEEIAY